MTSFRYCHLCAANGTSQKLFILQYRGFMTDAKIGDPEEPEEENLMRGNIAGADHYWCSCCRKNFDLEMKELTIDPDQKLRTMDIINDVDKLNLTKEGQKESTKVQVETAGDPELLP